MIGQQWLLARRLASTCEREREREVYDAASFSLSSSLPTNHLRISATHHHHHHLLTTPRDHPNIVSTLRCAMRPIQLPAGYEEEQALDDPWEIYILQVGGGGLLVVVVVDSSRWWRVESVVLGCWLQRKGALG